MTTEEGDDRGAADAAPQRPPPMRPFPAGAPDDRWQSGGLPPASPDPRRPPPAPSPPSGPGPAYERPSPTRAMRPRGYAPRPRRRFALRPLLLVPFAAAIMFGSLRVWVSASVAHQTLTIDGTHPAITAAYGVNGRASLAGGAALGAAALVLTVWRNPAVKLLAFLGAFAGLAVGVYDLVRILHDMSQAHATAIERSPLAAQLLGNTTIGYGLIVVVAASFVALLLTLGDMEPSR
jgi:hypothetical protein